MLIHRSAVACVGVLSATGCFHTLPAAADATAPCAQITRLLDQARDNFPSSGTATATGALTQGADCTLHRLHGGSGSLQCTWSFDYRDAAAAALYSSLDSTMEFCLGDAASVADDQPVNHPDTYRQRRYRAQNVAVTVSLKDKAALNQSLVFLAFTGNPPD